MKDRRAMIEVTPSISMRRQCELLGVSRSSVYYDPVATSAEELALMRRIDELHLKIPFYGSRKIADCLRREGKDVNRKLVQRLMRLMDIEGIAPKPTTSRPAPEHTTYPYLLRNVKICRVDQVWCADVTYIPMAHGFVYLVAIMDWYSRRVLAWRLSNTMDPGFCIEALREALLANEATCRAEHIAPNVACVRATPITAAPRTRHTCRGIQLEAPRLENDAAHWLAVWSEFFEGVTLLLRT
ncbi:MAG: IS3 family transposase [Deltaproteobacteria bacterium]